MKILAATDFSTRSYRALRQAGLLARPDTQLHVLHVVDDDQPADLIDIERRESHRILREQIDSIPELRDVDARPRVVEGDPFDGILRASDEVKPDLIVMGTHRKQLLRDIFQGTTIERVIRKGSVPVLMVNNEAQKTYDHVVAPVDMSDASANALRVGISTGLIDERGATLLHAFWAPAKSKLRLAGSDQTSIDSYVADERQRTADEMSAFLAANGLSDTKWSVQLREGEATQVIAEMVAQTHPDLLVMGTHGRSGLLKALIGSVTEQVLRSVSVDILAVPPQR